MRVLVTGGRGFIGRRIVEELHGAGHEPVVFDLASGLDVRDAASISSALRGVDAVCHQAGKVGLGVSVADYPEYASHNDLGTATLLASMAAAGIRHLVLASSMVVYGEGTYACRSHGPIAPGPRFAADLDVRRFEPLCPCCQGDLEPRLVYEDAPLDPRNAYAASKVAKEHYARAWANATDGRVIALRYHNVYGPGLPVDTPYAGVAALFRSAVRRKEAPRVFEDGGQRRDFVHTRDVARANVIALEEILSSTVGGGRGDASAGGRPARQFRAFNIGSGTPRTILDMATEMSRALDGPSPAITSEYRIGDVRHITASSSLAAEQLGWKAEVPFSEGISELALEDSHAADGGGRLRDRAGKDDSR